MIVVRLKPGREKSLLRRHPWVFSGAIAVVDGTPENGDTVEVVDSKGQFIGWGAYSSNSQIRVRIWSWESHAVIGEAFFHDRLTSALGARRDLIPANQTNALRLVHSESDGLPGLIVDRYADFLVMQCLSSGTERWRELLADMLIELSGAKGIFERSDVDVRKLEGLPERTGVIRGLEPPERVQIEENNLIFWVDVRRGHKTGFYLDQRSNRARVRQLAQGKHVLDCFSYTGGFMIHAIAGGAASALAVESSATALTLSQENLSLNSLPSENAKYLEGDAFHILRDFRDRRQYFDLIILDPPKFAPTAAQAGRAARAYKDINMLAFKLLNPGGLLVTFSCSGGIDAGLFQKIVAGAALDANIDARIVERLQQGLDHPVGLYFPEGEYLKGLIVRRES